MPRVVGVIPAHLESTRLPRKVLLADTGKPLIQHTWEAACKAEELDDVLITTDSWEIKRRCEEFGATVHKSSTWINGTLRVMEALYGAPPSTVVVNIQADEPEIEPRCIDYLVERMFSNSKPDIATLCCGTSDYDMAMSESNVKVVTDSLGVAMYFSRLPIPYRATYWKIHKGVYAYWANVLRSITSLSKSAVEACENLEQLRWLEAGFKIQVVDCLGLCSYPGVDTPEEYAAFVRRYRSKHNE